jgi:hypothetical protein
MPLRFRKFVITAARIVVIVAIAIFGPNVRGKPLDA